MRTVIYESNESGSSNTRQCQGSMKKWFGWVRLASGLSKDFNWEKIRFGFWTSNL